MEKQMTNTQRLFTRIDRDQTSYSEAARPHVKIGSLMAYLEILAEKFPEVDAYIGEMEDYMDGQ